MSTMYDRRVEKWAALGWMECAGKIRTSVQFLEQARKMYPAYRLLHGDLNAMTEDEFLLECARLMALFISGECKKHLDEGRDSTGNVGGIQIVREDYGGGTNYRIVLHGAFVNEMRLILGDKEES